MNDQTNYTPSIDDNLLGITDKATLNLYEASGVVKSEILLQSLEEDVDFSIDLILQVHRTTFGELYDWAGKWRTIEV